MGPRFFPTYKKMVSRGKTNYRSPEWVNSVYVTKFKVRGTRRHAHMQPLYHLYRPTPPL